MGGMGFQPYYPGRGSQGVLRAKQRAQMKVTGASADTVTIEKKAFLKTICSTGGEPRVSATAEGRISIDTTTGWPKTIEMECKTIVVTENLSRRTVLNLKWQLLEGAEREAALVPQSERKPGPPDWTKIMNQLNSEDNFKREMAARELTMSANQSIVPPPDLLMLLAKLENDSSDVVRQAVFTMLAGFGATEHVPLLLKGLRNPDDAAIRLACAKGLGRLKDPRAVEPLANLLAAGQSDQFSSRMSRPNPVTDALIHIGPEAEDAVAALLKEKNVDTLSQACAVLKSIGTGKSLPALKELTAYPNKELSEAAADASRSIQSRGEK
jgi:HEAT repeat protein